MSCFVLKGLRPSNSLTKYLSEVASGKMGKNGNDLCFKNNKDIKMAKRFYPDQDQ